MTLITVLYECEKAVYRAAGRRGVIPNFDTEFYWAFTRGCNGAETSNVTGYADAFRTGKRVAQGASIAEELDAYIDRHCVQIEIECDEPGEQLWGSVTEKAVLN